jgi:hypothetical protein
MPDFDLHTISNGIDLDKETLLRAYSATINEMVEAYKKRGILRKLFDIELIGDEIRVTLKDFKLSLNSERNLVFSGNSLMISMKFNYKDNEKDVTLIRLLMGNNGVIYISDIDGEQLDPRQLDVGYEAFGLIAKEAHAQRLISI